MKILKYNEHNHSDLEVGGLKCDNPNCDYSDMTVPFEDYESSVNKPCPKCGENLLTQEDYDQIVQLRNAVDILNSFSPEELEKISANLSPEEIDSALDMMNLLKVKSKGQDEEGNHVWSLGESKKEKDSEEVKFDVKSFEPKKDDLVGFKSEFEETPEKEVKKTKKEIQNDGNTPGLKKAIKKFEDFRISISVDEVEPEEDFFDTNDSCSDCQCDPCECEEPTQELQYHLMNSLPVTENVFRPGSKKFFALLKEARNLYDSGLLELKGIDKELYESTEIGKFAMFKGEMVALDIPMEYVEELNEAEYKGKEVKLNYPMRGGTKKYYVYVRNPKTGKVKKIAFGDVHGGLTAKVSNPEARRSFAARHKCKDKKDKTKAGYWACRINRYGHLWNNMTYPGFW